EAFLARRPARRTARAPPAPAAVSGVHRGRLAWGSMLPLLLLAATAEADVVRATLAVDADRVELVHAVQLPGELADADGGVVVRDAAGAEVGRTALPPLAAHRSVLLPAGPQTAPVPSRYVRVVVPWPEGARSLQVGAAVLDVAGSPRL